MFYVYILKSINFEKFYTGYTVDLDNRLNDHNTGKSTYSSKFMPWKIVYFETFTIKESAIRRERYFKSSAGRKWLKKNVNINNTSRSGGMADARDSKSRA